MKFDTIIIGGGLTGLIAGIRLQKSGKKCAILSGGQCALHFSSGSFDLLHSLPDGSPVHNPEEGLSALMRQSQAHPYAKIGETLFAKYAEEIPRLLRECGVRVTGASTRNSYRMTPMGTFSPTWLTVEGCPAAENPDSLPWKNACIFHIQGFLDFYPDFIAGELEKRGIACEVHEIKFPPFEKLRDNPTEMRSVNLARVLKKYMDENTLTRLLQRESEGCDTVIFPALVELEDVPARYPRV